jgi:hypothetical protein
MVAHARGGGGGLLALGDVFNQLHYEQIVALALKYNPDTRRLSSSHRGRRAYVLLGGLSRPLPPLGILRRSHTQRG